MNLVTPLTGLLGSEDSDRLVVRPLGGYFRFSFIVCHLSLSLCDLYYLIARAIDLRSIAEAGPWLPPVALRKSAASVGQPGFPASVANVWRVNGVTSCAFTWL